MMTDKNYGCAHWESERDIVALKCPCHGEFHPCLSCHKDKHGVLPERWKPEVWNSEKAILCRACSATMTIGEYMACASACPSCGAAFNPGCRNHWPLYFQMDDA